MQPLFSKCFNQLGKFKFLFQRKSNFSKAGNSQIDSGSSLNKLFLKSKYTKSDNFPISFGIKSILLLRKLNSLFLNKE